MRRARAVSLTALIFIGLQLSCVDGSTPVDPGSGGLAASLAVVPVLPQAAQAAGSAPINLIRLTAFAVPGDVQVAQVIRSVDPNADQWELEFDVPLSNEPGVHYVLEIELVNEQGGGQTVQWSGRTAPLTLTPGVAYQVHQVGVTRGPLDNLSVTSLVVEGPATVPEQQDFTLKALVEVSQSGAQATVFWTSLDPTIATVQADGSGTTLRAGTARIQAQAGPVTVIHQIQVTQVPSAVEVTPAAVELTDVGQVAEFAVRVLDGSGSPISGAAVTWTVADERIVEALGQGRFRSLAAGQTAVTATSVDNPALSGSGVVTVSLTPVGVSIDPAPVVLTRIGESSALTANVVAAGGVPVFGVSTSWTSSNVGVATVDQDGVVTAVGPGETTITVRTAPVGSPPAPLTATAKVTVVLTAASVQVTPTSTTLTTLGQQLAFQAAAIDANGGTIPNATFTWTSSNDAVATVNAAGVVTAVADGTATITARSGNTSGSATVTVGFVIETVTVEPPSATLALATQLTLAAVARDANGESVPATFTWATSDALVASVTNGGVVTANEFGQAVITATANGVSGSSTITVQGSPTPVNSFYETVGNTELVTGAYPDPGSAHVYVAENALAASPGLTITSAGVFQSAQNGRVELQADGDFSYTPPLGFEGTDQFDFTVTGGATATVQVEVIGMVWYVDNAADGGGLSNYPGGGPSIGGPGDIIFVYASGGYPISFGFTLQDGQQLIGEAAGLTIQPFGQIMPPGATPQVSGPGVTLANNVSVKGLDVANTAAEGIVGNAVSGVTVEDVRVLNAGYTGVALTDPTGTIDFNNLVIDGTGYYGFYVLGGDADVNVNLGGTVGIQAPSRHIVRVENTLGGTVTFSGSDIVSVDQRGVKVLGSAGDVIINNDVTVTNPANDGLSVQNGSGSVYLSRLDAVVTGRSGIHVYNNTGLVEVGDGTIQVTDAPGLDLNLGDVDLNLASVVVSTFDSGNSLYLEGITGTTTIGLLTIVHQDTGSSMWVDNAGIFNVTDPASTILADSDDGIHLFDTQVSLTFASVQVDGPFGVGVDMQLLSGSVAIAGGNVSNTSSDAIRMVNSTADFSFGGDILSPGGLALSMDQVTNATVQLTGSIQSTAGGVSLTNNTGTDFLFSGDLNLQTGANNAFWVSDAAMLEVTGAGNVISTTTGMAAYISNLVIGAGNVVFQSVSANGANIGVWAQLYGGSTGGLKITGTGTPGSGGTIQNTTSDGIKLTFTRNLELTDMILSNVGGTAISGMARDFTFDGLQILTPGAWGMNLKVDGISQITNTTVDGARQGNLFMPDVGADLMLDISNSTFTGNGTVGGSQALQFVKFSAGSMQATLSGVTVSSSLGGGVHLQWSAGAAANLTILNSTFAQNQGPHVAVEARDGGSVEALVAGSTFDQGGGNGIELRTSGTGTLVAEVSDNQFTSIWDDALFLAADGGQLGIRAFNNNVAGSTYGAGIYGAADGSGALRGWIAGNVINGTSQAGIQFESGVASGSTASVDLNVVDNVVGSTNPDPRTVFVQRESAAMCLSVTENQTAPGDVTSIKLSQVPGVTNNFRLERLNGGVGTETNPTVVNDYVAAENPDGVWPSTTIVTAFAGVPNGTCALPPAPAGAPNAPPVAHSQGTTTDGSTPQVILLNGADPDGDALTFSIVTPPSIGALGSITPLTSTTAQVTYTPAGTGYDLFTFRVSDGSATADATVSVDNLAPAPQPITYVTAGNTALVAGGYAAPSTPAAANPDNIFDPTPGLTASNAGFVSTTQGGDVDLLADGSFSYLPPAGFKGDDTFPVNTASGSATVTVTVTDMVWYVDNTSAGGDGRSDAPFPTLAEASSASVDGDAIFVYAGDLTTTGYDQGIDLYQGQRLIGEVYGLNVPGVGELVAPGGSRPTLNSSGLPHTVGIGTGAPGDNLVAGLTLWAGSLGLEGFNLGTTLVDDVVIINAGAGVRLSGAVGSITFTNADVTGEDDIAFEVSGGNPNVSYSGVLTCDIGTLLDVSNTTGGTLTFNGSNVVLDEDGVSVFNSASTLVMDNLDVKAAGWRGIRIQNSSGSFTFNGVTMAATSNNAVEVTGGAPTVSVDVLPAGINNAQNHLLYVNGTTGGSVSFTGGPMTDNGGLGVEVSGSNAGSVSIANALAMGTSAGPASVYLDNSNGPVTLSDVTISASGVPGLVHQNGTGLLTILAGSIDVTDIIGLQVTSAPVDLNLSDVTVTSSNGDYGLFEIQDAAASSTVIGNLALSSTGAGIPLVLNNAGSFQVAGGSMSATTQGAADIVSTDLDVTLSSLSSTTPFGWGLSIGSSSGTLAAAAGALNTSGSGGVSLTSNSELYFTYEGTIDNSAGPAVLASGNTSETASLSFGGGITDTGEGIQLVNNDGTGIDFSGDLDVDVYNVPALAATGWNTVNVTGATNTLASANSTAVILSDLRGTNTLDNVSASSGSGSALAVSQTGSNATLTVNGGDFSNNSGGGGMVASTSLLGKLTLAIVGTTISNNANEGILATALGASTLDLTVGGTLDTNDTGIHLVNGDDAVLTFDLDGSTITNSADKGVFIDATTATGNMDGFVRNNTITGSGNRGVMVNALGPGVATVDVSSNVISGFTVDGAYGVGAQSGQVTGDTGDLHLTVFDNDIEVNSLGWGVDVQTWQDASLCANIKTNRFVDASGGSGTAIGVLESDNAVFKLERLSSNAAAGQEALVTAQLDADNPVLGGMSTAAFIYGVPGFGAAAAGTCRVPTP